MILSIKKILHKYLNKQMIHILSLVFVAIKRIINRNYKLLSLRAQQKNIGKIVRKFADPHMHVFFGYYDVTPFSANNEYLLATKARLKNVAPSPNEELIVGYYDLKKENSFIELGSTTTWCWQQGCRLSWYNNEFVTYNKVVDGKNGAVIQNIKTKNIKRKLCMPIYDITPDGKWGLSLDFSRLQRLRPGYGYTTFPDESQGQKAPPDNGIWLVDIKNNNSRLLFSINDIAKISPRDSMKEAEHYFNLLSFSPDGKRLMFFHWWKKGDKRTSRLFIADREGENLRLLENETIVSHYTWKNDNELLITGIHPKEGFHYWLYNINTGERSIIGENILMSDGHPTYFSNKKYMVTDTYPDQYGDQSILLYNIQSSNTTTLAAFYTPIKFLGEIRCDLHPRLNLNNELICVDVIKRAKREIVIVTCP